MKTAITIKVSPPQFTEYTLPPTAETSPDGLRNIPPSSFPPVSEDESEPNQPEENLLRQPAIVPPLNGDAPNPAPEGPADSTQTVVPAHPNSAGNSAFALVFSLKEFRALLHFTTGIGAPIILTFTEPSQFAPFFIAHSPPISNSSFTHYY